jgi:hypothetical protein
MIGGIEKTSASSEARSAPRSYPTNPDMSGLLREDAILVQRVESVLTALIGTPKVGCAAPLRGKGRRPSGKS